MTAETFDMLPKWNNIKIPKRIGGYSRPWIIIKNRTPRCRFLLIARLRLSQAGGSRGREKPFDLSNPPSQKLHYYKVENDLGKRLWRVDEYLATEFAKLEGKRAGVEVTEAKYRCLAYGRRVFDYFLARLWHDAEKDPSSPPRYIETIDCSYLNHVLDCVLHGREIEPLPLELEVSVSISFPHSTTTALRHTNCRPAQIPLTRLGPPNKSRPATSQPNKHTDVADAQAVIENDHDIQPKASSHSHQEKNQGVNPTGTNLHDIALGLYMDINGKRVEYLRPTCLSILALDQLDELNLEVDSHQEAQWLIMFLETAMMVVVEALWAGRSQHDVKIKGIFTNRIPAWREAIKLRTELLE